MGTYTLLVLSLSLAANMYLLVRQTRLRGLLRTALRKAESDRCEMVRIPYNQLAKEMGWQPEFEENVRISAYPMRDRIPSGHTRHPALLSPARRGKL